MDRTEERDGKLTAFLLCIVAAGASLVGFVSPEASTAISILIAGILILWANPLGIPALAVLWIRAADFRLFGATSQASQLGQESLPGALYVAGFPMSLQLFTMLCITAFVIFESIRVTTFPKLGIKRTSRAKHQVTDVVGALSASKSQRHQLNRGTNLTFVIWLAFLGITVISTLWGRSQGNENWTQPLRASMAMASFFYGFILLRKLDGRYWIMEWSMWIAAIVLVLVAIGVYWNHSAFYYVALSGVAFWSIKNRRRGFLAVILGLSAIATVLGPGDTLTILLLLAGGLFAGFFLFHKNQILGRKVTAVWTLLVIPLSTVIIALALSANPSSIWNTSKDVGLLERIEFKLYQDRGTLWRAAWDLAIHDPELISPSGRTLIVEMPIVREGYVLWKIHVHNAYLELLRQTGILGAMLFVALVIMMWWRLRNTLLHSLHPLIRIFGCASLVTIAVGGLTGLFPFDFFAGPWVWLWAGVTVGFRKSARTSTFPVPLSRESSDHNLSRRVIAT